MSTRVLVFVAHYLPGFKSGGPIQSIANLVDQLGETVSFKIVTADRDSGDKKRYAGIEDKKWQRVGKAQVYYARPEELTLRNIAAVIRETPHDTLYLNSFFNPTFTSLPLVAHALGLVPKTQIILAPRGEFSHEALALKSTKKTVFIALSKIIGLHANLVWQASSEYEASDIRTCMGSIAHNIKIASDLPRQPATLGPRLMDREPNGPIRIVFLSRIVPMKNLTFALGVLRDVSVPIEFSIFGPVEDEQYWHLCTSIISTLPPHIRVDHHGPVESENVIQTLSQHDLFFLPSLGENYGHVIAEALQSGLPVLISDKTPWRNLKQAGVGYDCSLEDPQSFGKYITEIAGLSPDSTLKLRNRIREYADKITNNQNNLDASRELFLPASN